jgi:L-seryl-tRNA(Ser) seleniumtransferase
LTTPGDNDVQASAFRSLPSVGRLARDAALSHLGHDAAVRAARHVIDEARDILRAGGDAPTAETLAARAAEFAAEADRPCIRRAVNAIGVLLHTNLGRATLADAAVRAAEAVAVGHASLEVDEETGGRGSRQSACADLLKRLTGAEDAYVVNNNAAATFLAVAGVAAGREIILSRGQLVEIGGQFRLPDVIESAGARLREVGTTNRTRIGDYERAVGPETAMLLRVHPSNFRVVGFTEEASLAELVALGKRTGVPVGDDIGSGALVDFAPYGLGDEPMAPRSIAEGADLVWFSGDKLLGGPQSGILVGRSDLLGPLKKHPLARALRPDKMTLAALEATLRLYEAGRAWDEVPTLRRIARPAEDVLHACGRVARALRAIAPSLEVDIIAAASEIGGGSLPGHTLPSWAVAVDAGPRGAADLARALRKAETPVYGRIEKGRLLLDLRAVDEREEELLVLAFADLSPAA